LTLCNDQRLRSDRERELVEADAYAVDGAVISDAVVVAGTQVLHECVTCGDDPG
jgi:hypothetical protein